MKRLIASDLHGSARFCRQLLERYQQEGAQQLILLGDLVYSGSYDPQYEYDPHQVIHLLSRRQRQMCIRDRDHRTRNRPSHPAAPPPGPGDSVGRGKL